MNANKHNQVTTVYYLLHKRYEKLGKLDSHFKIINKSTNGGSAFKQGETSKERMTNEEGNNSLDFGIGNLQ